MPMLATLILLLTAPAPVDRSSTFSEVEPPPDLSTSEAPAADTESTPPAAPSAPIVADPTPIPVPPPPPPARPDRPIRWRVDIVGDLGNALLRDRAWRAFDDNRHVLLPGLSVRADTRIGGGRLFLGGGASYRSFSGYNSLYGTTWTGAQAREPLLFARLSAVMIEGVDLFVQAGGGVSIVDINVDSTQSAAQRAVAGVVDGQGGAALYLPKRWLRRRGASRVTGGLEFAAGYSWRSAIDVRPQISTDEDPIPTTGASLGDLSLRGVQWRVGLFLRFQ